MDKRYLSEGQTAAFARALRAAERSPGTIEKYLRDVCQFAAWAGGGEVSRERTAAWRDISAAPAIRAAPAFFAAGRKEYTDSAQAPAGHLP